MRHLRLIPIAIVLAALSSSCHSSPVSPSTATAPVATTTTPLFTTTGRTVDALTGAPLASVTVSTDEGASAVTDVDGRFQLTAPDTGLCRVIAAGPAVVQRETEIRMREADASLSLIPAQFDLAAFDQMLRDAGALRRWTGAPSLVIIDAVLQFTALSDSRFTALNERLTDDERSSMGADLAWGLPQVTGGAFAAFASVTIESPAPGARVDFFSREGTIVVARFRGLSLGTGYWGYGRWATRDHDVVAGAIMLDRDVEAAHGPYTRSLRVHELGHALGYCHVTKRQSFMNSAAVYEPNDFDRDASRIAFQRAPGNQSPDRDPARVGASRRSASMTWGAITP